MKEFLEHQFQNLFLWSPFVMAFGAGLYFSLPTEPTLGVPLLVAALIAAVLFFRRTTVVTTALLLFLFGFFYAVGFTRIINTPQITRDLRNIPIEGMVTNIDYTSNKARIFIKVPANQLNNDLSADKTALIRLSVGDENTIPKIGDLIDARVSLFQPSSAYTPNSFDYSRWAYFNGITATGFLNSYNADPVSTNKSANINTLRNYIHDKTKSFLADTLVLGYKNAVPKEDGPVWTATGVGHVWSISGFHMTLVGGWLFALFYLIFRSIAPITKRLPARIPATICAWFGLLFYLFLSGIDVATVRAFLMTTLIFTAFLFGRNSFSMRNICMAFILIFLINPHYVMQPGFQLSFSAIFGLIWFFGHGKYIKLSFVQKIWRVIKAATMTSIIATLFTAPFVASHFYSLPIYGLLGNLILLPIFSLAIMPLVIIGTITALFGFIMPLTLAESLYDGTLFVAHKIADLPFAQLQIPYVPLSALVLIILGFLCLMFIKNTESKVKMNRVLFSFFFAVSIVLIATNPKPLFYATPDHELVAFVYDGKLKFNKGRASNHYFAFNSWKQMNFEPIDTPNTRQKCDKGVCLYKTPRWTLAYMQKYVPLSKNIVSMCRDAEIDFIVSYFQIDAAACNHKILHNGFVLYKSGRIIHTPTGRWWHVAH